MGRSITVRCEGDAYIDDFETEDLVKELKRRKQPVFEQREQHELHEVREALVEHRYHDALAYLDRILWPKWKSEDACTTAIEKLRKRQ